VIERNNLDRIFEEAVSQIVGVKDSLWRDHRFVGAAGQLVGKYRGRNQEQEDAHTGPELPTDE
jgi:hypothetical protein